MHIDSIGIQKNKSEKLDCSDTGSYERKGRKEERKKERKEEKRKKKFVCGLM